MKKCLSFGLVLALILSLAAGMSAAVETEKEYTPITAENEDAGISMWFDHPYMKVQPDDTTSSGRNTYTIYMAKNEIEGCQFFLAPTEAKNGLTASVTPFVNENGDEVATEVFKEYYTSAGAQGLMPDQLIPYSGEAFDLSENRSQAFYVKAKTLETTPYGDYESTVTVRDSEGKEVKKAKIFLHVWKFALSEKTECKSTIYLDRSRLKAMHGTSSLSESELYEVYYNYLLENRICAFNIPVSVQNKASTLEKYLDNPRVNTFRIGDFSYNGSISIRSLYDVYEVLESREGWLDKAYFYPVDEPFAPDHFQNLANQASAIQPEFPGAKIMVPYNQIRVVSQEPFVDSIEFSKPYVNLWCPKTEAFLTRAEQDKYNAGEWKDAKVQTMTDVAFAGGGELTDEALAASKFVDSMYGKEVYQRLYEEQAAGDELWWYVTSGPRYPFCNLLIESEGLSHRVLFWQQKMYNISGFLYYYANAWFPVSSPNDIGYHGWDDANFRSGLQGVVHGNGVLIWPGSDVGIDGPVGSFRIEGIRDGIEDFQYLCMYENLFGKDQMNELIHQVTISVAEYNSDGDNFLNTKLALGNAIEASLYPPCADGEHVGGTATCIAKAVCDKCHYEYGDFAPHTGGTATCIAKAVCDICHSEYGDFAPHTGGTATCSAPAVCDVCGQPYGEVDPENHHYVDGVCEWCSQPEPVTFVWGDADSDGKVDSKDAVQIARTLAKWNVEINLEAVDFDGDGKLTSGEAVHVSRYLAKWSNLPYRIGEKGGSAKAE